MSRRAQTPSGTDVTVFGDLPGDNDNPLLESVPTVRTLSIAMRLIVVQETQNVIGWSVQELTAHEAANSFASDATRASLCINAITQVRTSYRDHSIRANHFLHRSLDERRHAMVSRFSIAPRAKPRGIAVAPPPGTGRRRLADMVASALGSEPHVTRTAADTSFTEYFQRPVLRMAWRIDGKLSGFTKEFIAAFDAAFQTRYVSDTRTPLVRERNIVPAVCPLDNRDLQTCNAPESAHAATGAGNNPKAASTRSFRPRNVTGHGNKDRLAGLGDDK
ncbi:hypothetical protein [Paraburkholderia caffeinilytica]|uniref:hypothetical protein n=1 Tax=Paraburkholderia caffeinilytica TaxID=1761016 RepID=UPI003DA142D6